MSHIAMPTPDQAILQHRNELLKELAKLVPEATLIADQVGRRTFETDALTAYRSMPLAVLLPSSIGRAPSADLSRRTVTSVTTPSWPSDPAIKPRKS